MVYLVIILFVLLISLAIAGSSSAPFLPARTKDLERILKLSQIQKGQTFYDLGCGNGKVVHYIANNSHANVIGIEMAIPIYIWAKIRQLFSKGKKYKIIFNSFFNVNLSNADVIYIFGYPKTIKSRVEKKLKQDLRPGARIISYAFKMPGWQPVMKEQPTKDDMPIYIYIR